MSLFSYENQQDFFGNNNTSIECSKCSELDQKYMRCNCCNEIITLPDLIKHINRNNEIVKLVRLSGLLCVKMRVIDIYLLSKYFTNLNNTYTSAANFEVKTNYIESKTTEGDVIKSVRNIEFVSLLSNFKEVAIDVKHLLMNNTMNKAAEVLINVEAFNVQLPNL
jgi:hypothetical protein